MLEFGSQNDRRNSRQDIGNDPAGRRASTFTPHYYQHFRKKKIALSFTLKYFIHN